jgi:hypothetical protein
VRILGANEPLNGSDDLDISSVPKNRTALVTSYGPGKVFGLRQSKRLRQVKQGEQRKLTVGKQTTVKDIKVAVSSSTP